MRRRKETRGARGRQTRPWWGVVNWVLCSMAGSGVSWATDSPRVATLPNNSSLKQNASRTHKHTHNHSLSGQRGSWSAQLCSALLDLTWRENRRGAREAWWDVCCGQNVQWVETFTLKQSWVSNLNIVWIHMRIKNMLSVRLSWLFCLRWHHFLYILPNWKSRIL